MAKRHFIEPCKVLRKLDVDLITLRTIAGVAIGLVAVLSLAHTSWRSYMCLHGRTSYVPNPAAMAFSSPPWRSPLCNLVPISTACDAFLHGSQAAVFMHLYPKNAWRVVLEDTVRVVQHSGLSLCGVSFFYGLPPEQEWPFGGRDPMFLPMNTSEHGRSKPHTELQTLAALYQWCGTHPQAFVAYTHDKGTRRGPEDVTLFFRQWDWRRLHEYFILEVPSGCLAALNSGAYDTCGASKKLTPALHYSGNFWWATCRHINRLGNPYDYDWPNKDPMVSRTFSPEFWIGSQLQPERAFNCYNWTGNHYEQEYPRYLYSGSTCELDMTAEH